MQLNAKTTSIILLFFTNVAVNGAPVEASTQGLQPRSNTHSLSLLNSLNIVTRDEKFQGRSPIPEPQQERPIYGGDQNGPPPPENDNNRNTPTQNSRNRPVPREAQYQRPPAPLQNFGDQNGAQSGGNRKGADHSIPREVDSQTDVRPPPPKISGTQNGPPQQDVRIIGNRPAPREAQRAYQDDDNQRPPPPPNQNVGNQNGAQNGQQNGGNQNGAQNSVQNSANRPIPREAQRNPPQNNGNQNAPPQGARNGANQNAPPQGAQNGANRPAP